MEQQEPQMGIKEMARAMAKVETEMGKVKAKVDSTT